MALWLLWKQQRRVQQQQPDASQGQPHHTGTEQQPEQQPEQPTRADASSGLAALSLQDDAVSSGAASAEQQQQQQLALGQQVYSRDEVAQMLVQGQLTGAKAVCHTHHVQGGLVAVPAAGESAECSSLCCVDMDTHVPPLLPSVPCCVVCPSVHLFCVPAPNS